MSTVAHPHSTELQVLKGAQPSVHGTTQRVHMGQGAATGGCLDVALCFTAEQGKCQTSSLQAML